MERKSLRLAEFIEQVGGDELKPYQKEMIAAIERGEKIVLCPLTMLKPYREWKQLHQEYLAKLMRSNLGL